jgi:transcription initiation factor TFIIA large subunit
MLVLIRHFSHHVIVQPGSREFFSIPWDMRFFLLSIHKNSHADILLQGWQQKLSQLQVATFPWDPKPEPQQSIANPPTVPSNAGNYQAMNTPPIGQAQPGLTLTPMNQNANGPRIKSEPGMESPPGGIPHQPYPNPVLNMPSGANTAQQRAVANLANSYGARAAASINAIQGNLPQQQQSSQPNMQQMQQHPAMQTHQLQHMQQQRVAQGSRPQMTQEQYRQQMAQQMAQAQQQAQQRVQTQNGVNAAQTDGAGDDIEEAIGVITGVNADGTEVMMGRIEIDGLIRTKIEAMGQSMEGGGLMLPLHKVAKSEKRQRKSKSSRSVPQHDGPGSDDDDDSKDNLKDEELDEDAINSDLDDPDDGLNDDEDDEETMGHIMLCMYDKVQRVKNKW